MPGTNPFVKSRQQEPRLGGRAYREPGFSRGLSAREKLALPACWFPSFPREARERERRTCRFRLGVRENLLLFHHGHALFGGGDAWGKFENLDASEVDFGAFGLKA